LDYGVGGVELMWAGVSEPVQLGLQLGVGSQVVAQNGEGLPLDVLFFDWGACPVSFASVGNNSGHFVAIRVEDVEEFRGRGGVRFRGGDCFL
jgi:hypothetical protein